MVRVFLWVVLSALLLCLAWALLPHRVIHVVYVDGERLKEGSEELERVSPHIIGLNRSGPRCRLGDIVAGKASEACQDHWNFDQTTWRNAHTSPRTCDLREGRTYLEFEISYRRYVTLHAVRLGLDCETVPFAQATLYEQVKVQRVRTGLLTQEDRAHHVEVRAELHYLPPLEWNRKAGGRYLAVRTSADEGLKRVFWGSDLSRIERPKPQPAAGGSGGSTSSNWGWSLFKSSPSLPTSDPRWSAAAIALGRANAKGCGEFTVTASGRAHCVGSGETWTIDFRNKRAWR
ncbi:hypothetical protein GE300_20180 [Rhodobacteraceae bacterium 2CG4]|uniref:Uncharacterized protein n=1 Tax=Halovulum marinum TaxID=2662447 RepID=A0A6L5Z6Y9_9RHOB|nr:hypothetical protein [Halovulum marinum]MSU91890.1 hypothetical protein [Halovulum marinum]